MKTLTITLLVSVMFCLPLIAQEDVGGINGTVRDATGALFRVWESP